jgi:hypothetical protein
MTSIRGGITCMALVLAASGCGPSADAPSRSAFDPDDVAAAVEAAVWRFHAADTARDAEGVLALLWPEYEMRVDGALIDFESIASGSREFMAGLRVFHTEWTDLRIVPLSETLAVASFRFEDSLVATTGELTRSWGPTTLIWERRADEWRAVFGDADHYPVAAAEDGG